MSGQPTIVEEPLQKEMPRGSCVPNEERFFTLLDAVEEYDSASSKIRQKYQEAMFGLAATKFTDPNSLNLTAHKCLPAFLKLSPKNQLQHGYSAFANKVAEEDIDGEEYENQEEIEEKCAQKQAVYEEAATEKEKEVLCENQLLHRFNVLNQHDRVLGVAGQFKEVIELLLELENCRRSFEGTVSKMEASQ